MFVNRTQVIISADIRCSSSDLSTVQFEISNVFARGATVFDFVLIYSGSLQIVHPGRSLVSPITLSLPEVRRNLKA